MPVKVGVSGASINIATATQAISSPQSSLTDLIRPWRRRDKLWNGLPAAVDALRRGDVAIPDGFIADYVALRWLAWCNGSLSLTALGQRICVGASNKVTTALLIA